MRNKTREEMIEDILEELDLGHFQTVTGGGMYEQWLELRDYGVLYHANGGWNIDCGIDVFAPTNDLLNYIGYLQKVVFRAEKQMLWIDDCDDDKMDAMEGLNRLKVSKEELWESMLRRRDKIRKAKTKESDNEKND